MTFEFRLPDIGEGVAEGEVVHWFVEEGGSIQEDAPLVSVLTDKANVEIPSPRGGRIAKLHAKEGEKVKVGALLVTIEEAGATGPAPAAGQTPTPAAGPSGGTAETASSRGAAAPSAAVPPPTAAPPPTPAPAASARVLAAPYVRRLAAERGIDLSQLRGSGPNGRITEQDLDHPTPTPVAVPAPAPAAAPAARAVPEGAPAPRTEPAHAPTPSRGAPPSAGPPVAAGADDERIPIRGLRRVISEHMTEATHRAAHFTYVEEIDVSELVRTREKMAQHLEKQGTRLTFLPFIMKAVVAGLRAHPQMNASMDDEKNELVVHHRYHLGIAMAAPEGLIVPVVREVDSKSVGRLARELQDLSERGRAGKLGRSELTGSTFTITSLGSLGGVLATPILNYPEVAILGVHKIVRRPVYRTDGTLGPADLMNLSVSLDHLVIDGIVGAQFLSVVKANLEDPHLLFSELA